MSSFAVKWISLQRKMYIKHRINMKKNLLTFTLLAGALMVSSCASKKALENCQTTTIAMPKSSLQPARHA